MIEKWLHYKKKELYAKNNREVDTLENTGKEREKVVILDLGGRYNQLLARRIRELGVYSEIHPHTLTARELKNMNTKGVIISGDADRDRTADEAYVCDREIFSSGLPVLAIGYGMHVMTKLLNGTLEKNSEQKSGETEIRVKSGHALYTGLPEVQTVWMDGGDRVQDVPAGFTVDAESPSYAVAAMGNETNKLYGLQFHPEVHQSEYGEQVLKNFLLHICGCEANWSADYFIQTEIENIRQTVDDKKVLCALSGGVDSSVAAALIHKAIGDQLTCIFVDHGLLRKGEAESVMEAFAGKFRMNVIKIDAQQRFLNKLKGVTDPEQKRKIIGNEFIYVFEEESQKLEGIEFLAQGTLYSDVIESGTASSKAVKSHHNVGGLPEEMNFKLIEPLKTLFKDEVRKVGTELGVPDEIVWRQPFPGPGLGIRVLGEVTEEKLAIVRESDWILREEIKKAGLDREIWQYFTVLPNIRSVGVREDGRTYDYTIGIRAVNSVDGMTSDWARIPWDVLERISSRIVNEVPQVNRVVYDITTKPPATIEWE